MYYVKKLLSISIAFIIAISLVGCKQKVNSYVFTAFNCPVTICSYSKTINAKTKNLIKTFATDAENQFDINNENSFNAKFNNLEENQTLKLNQVELQIFNQAKTAYTLSGGKFNPTVYPLVKLWGFAPYKYTLNYTPPTQEQIEVELTKVDFSGVSVTQDGFISKNSNALTLDFGGIVKGYVADGIAKILKENGFNDGYVSVGTSSLNLLKVENLSVRHPQDGNKTLFTVHLNQFENLSVSTSGNYEKYHIDINGNKFCHLIDPDTGYPAQTGVASATLIGIDGTLADALTTAICLKEYSTENPLNPLTEFLSVIENEFSGVQIFVAVIKGQEKVLLTNKNLGQDFTLNDQDFTVINI